MNNLVNVSEGAYLALHGLVYIAENSPQRISVKKLSEVLSASEAHLAKVFQKLSKADLVESVRGPSGGFVLNADPNDVTFLDIYEIIDGKVNLNGCPFGKKECPFKACIFNSELNRISQEIIDSFKEIKLANFCS